MTPLKRFWPLMNPTERKFVTDMMIENMFYTLAWMSNELDERLYRLSDEANDAALRDRYAKALNGFMK